MKILEEALNEVAEEELQNSLSKLKTAGRLGDGNGRTIFKGISNPQADLATGRGRDGYYYYNVQEKKSPLLSSLVEPMPPSALNLEYPGQSDNFNGGDIISESRGRHADFDSDGLQNVDVAFSPELYSAYEEALSNLGNNVDEENQLNWLPPQPKLFSSFYNTPDSFRHGIEVCLLSLFLVLGSYKCRIISSLLAAMPAMSH